VRSTGWISTGVAGAREVRKNLTDFTIGKSKYRRGRLRPTISL
jgi:hypothetical protein